MTIEELNQILRTGEGTRVEYKAAQVGLPASLYETVSSFSNTDGGTIVFGVSDDGRILGLDAKVIPEYIKQLVSALGNPDTISPPLFLNPLRVTHPDGELIVLRVPASSLIHKYAGRVYWRSGDNDQDITLDDRKISDIYFRKKEYFTENEIFPYLTIQELDERLFAKARNIIRSVHPNHLWLTMNDLDLLKSSSLYRIDFRTGEEGLTRAAAMIFGKDETIQNIAPGYKVDALLRRVNLDRYDDRLELRTNLIDTYMTLNAFVLRHLEERFYIEHGQRKDLRELIFREVIGNMIVHREYSSAASSELIIYRDQVLLTNPNKPLFFGKLDPKTFNPYPKNPNIRKFFNAFGWTDELGSGVRNTRNYLNIYVPGAMPVFTEGDRFIAEIPLIMVSLATYFNELTLWFEFRDEIKEWIRDALPSCSLDVNMMDIDWDRLLLHLVPRWHENGTKYRELDWPVYQAHNEDSIKKVPGWTEKGTRLLHKKVNYLIRILLISLKPISLEQLMIWIGYSNKHTFRHNYLLPLQSVGFVRMTKPDQPSAKDQKYLTTEKGKQFLTAR